MKRDLQFLQDKQPQQVLALWKVAGNILTDLYIFQQPGDPTKSILILDVNPAATTLATTFDPAASYEFKW